MERKVNEQFKDQRWKMVKNELGPCISLDRSDDQDVIFKEVT